MYLCDSSRPGLFRLRTLFRLQVSRHHSAISTHMRGCTKQKSPINNINTVTHTPPHLALELLGDPREPRSGNAGGDGRDARLVPADTRVDDSGPGLLDRHRQLHYLFPIPPSTSQKTTNSGLEQGGSSTCTAVYFVVQQFYFIHHGRAFSREGRRAKKRCRFIFFLHFTFCFWMVSHRQVPSSAQVIRWKAFLATTVYR